MIRLKEVDKVEILTLQDNYIDLGTQDSNTIVLRPSPVIGEGETRNSIKAEHGFSVIVRTTAENCRRTMLLDFGFSPDGAAHNAKILGAPTEEVEIMALSHFHYDHTGGIAALTQMIGKPGIGLVLHPRAITPHRYAKNPEGVKIPLSTPTRSFLEAKGIEIIEAASPYPLLDDQILFLGEIERINDFEKGIPNAYRTNANGEEEWDPIEDDTAIVINVKGKGLVIISGCAHSGIINTVNYAKKITAEEKVHAVMGGFHLSGPLFEPRIDQTTNGLKALDPDYVIPCHCTGRKAVMHMEQAMPGRFILNMSGTKLTFSA